MENNKNEFIVEIKDSPNMKVLKIYFQIESQLPADHTSQFVHRQATFPPPLKKM